MILRALQPLQYGKETLLRQLSGVRHVIIRTTFVAEISAIQASLLGHELALT